MVNIDTVYQKVLAIANKEQRGYITPQEFNLFADQAQMEIFQQYFYDRDQFERRMGDDITKLIKSKIEFFKISSKSINNGGKIPANSYFIDSVYLKRKNDKGNVPVEKIDRDETFNIHAAMNWSPLLKSNESRPVYWIHGNSIHFHPYRIPRKLHTGEVVYDEPGTYKINFIKTPQKPNWTYVIDSVTQTALYNNSAPDLQHFEIHRSEENKLVIKILLLAGVSMKDFGLAQLAGQKEAGTTQQEKQ